MYDNALFFASLAEKKKIKLFEHLSLQREKYILVTIHRDTNTDDITRLHDILLTLMQLAEEMRIPMLMPFHPRTVNSLKANLEDFFAELNASTYIKIVPPVSYLEMILLEKNSLMIITDSGGVQKESHFFRKPCLVLRKETEWVELVKNGTAKLVDADTIKIREEFHSLIQNNKNLEYPGFYGDGKTAEFILSEILLMFNYEDK